jgi:hypothetical protein
MSFLHTILHLFLNAEPGMTFYFATLLLPWSSLEWLLKVSASSFRGGGLWAIVCNSGQEQPGDTQNLPLIL